jgi:hypothetical protein
MDITLAELPVEGAPRKVLLHAPKNGFFYVIDRKNGKVLSAEKIGKATWASHVDLETGRPIEIEGARYEDGEELVWPSPFGVHNWHAMSYSPKTGYVYIPTIEMPALFSDKGIDLKAWRSPKYRLSAGIAFATEDSPPDTGLAKLLAWDPVAQKRVWETSAREFPRHRSRTRSTAHSTSRYSSAGAAPVSTPGPSPRSTVGPTRSTRVGSSRSRWTPRCRCRLPHRRSFRRRAMFRGSRSMKSSPPPA